MHPSRWAMVAATLSVLLVAACTRAPSDPIAAARSELAAGQPQAAIVILKDALQEREDFAAARAELGRALLLSVRRLCCSSLSGLDGLVEAFGQPTADVCVVPDFAEELFLSRRVVANALHS